MAQLKNYEDCCYDGCNIDDADFELVKSDFNDYLKSIGQQKHVDEEKSLFAIKTCGLLQVGSCVIGPLGELYKCEHNLGVNDYTVGDIKNGIVFNENYNRLTNPIIYERCRGCKLFPICKLSVCHALYPFAGKNEKCNIYEMQNRKLNNYLKKMIVGV